MKLTYMQAYIWERRKYVRKSRKLRGRHRSRLFSCPEGLLCPGIYLNHDQNVKPCFRMQSVRRLGPRGGVGAIRCGLWWVAGASTMTLFFAVEALVLPCATRMFAPVLPIKVVADLTAIAVHALSTIPISICIAILCRVGMMLRATRLSLGVSRAKLRLVAKLPTLCTCRWRMGRNHGVNFCVALGPVQLHVVHLKCCCAPHRENFMIFIKLISMKVVNIMNESLIAV